MNRLKFLPALILGLASMAKAVIVSVDIGGAPGVEYVSIGEHGAVQVFSSARVLSTSMKKVHQGNLPLGAGERILGIPMVWRGADGQGFLVAAAVRGPSDAIRVWRVPSNDQDPPVQVAGTVVTGSIQDALPLIAGSARELLVRLPAAWKRIPLISTQAEPTPTLPSSLDAVAGPSWPTATAAAYLMAYDQTAIDVAWVDGTVSRCALADGGSCSSPVQILGTTDPVLRTPVARPWHDATSSDWLAIDANGDLWKTDASGTPAALSQAPDLKDAAALTSVFQRVQVLTRSGAMHELSAVNGAPIHRTAWHMRSGDLVVDDQGRPAAPTGQLGGSPSAFGTVLQGGHTVWGYFHHLGAFNIALYQIEPRTAKASTTNAANPEPSSVLIRYAVAGNENAFLRIVAEPTKAGPPWAPIEIVPTDKANSLTPRAKAWLLPAKDEDYKVHLQVCADQSDFTAGTVAVPPSCLDSILTVRVDRTLPAVAADWVVPLDGKSWPTADGNSSCAVLGDPLRFEVGGLPDAAPFADRMLDVELELRSRASGSNWILSPLKDGSSAIVTLNGFLQGVRIPSGQYDVSWKIKDSVGNQASVAVPPSCLEIRQFDFPFSLSASPQLVKSTGSGEVVLQVSGTYDYDKNAVVKVHLDDGATPIWEFQISAQATDKAFVLRKSFKIADLASSNAFGTAPVTGNHLAKATLTQLESNGNEIADRRREAKAVFAVDVFKTKIVDPTDAAVRTGRVGVRGMALPPELAAADDAAYFAYWMVSPLPADGSTPNPIASGIVGGPDMPNLEALLAGREWKPLLVPISNQRASLDGLVRTGRDSRFPYSNIGISLTSAEGLLATFEPPSDLKACLVTILVASQESPRGPISYDAVDFRWEPGALASAPSFELSRVATETGPLDLTSSSTASANFQARWPGAVGRTVRFLVYSGTMGTGSKQLRAEESGVAAVEGEDIARWSWDGRDFTGRQVPSGTYTVVAAGTSPDEGELVDHMELEVKSSPLGDASRVFRVSPQIVPSLVSIGIQQNVTAEVELTESLDWTVWAISRTDGNPFDPAVLEGMPAKGDLACPAGHVCTKVFRPEVASRSERIDWNFITTGTSSFLEGIPAVDGRIPVQLVLVAEDRIGIQHRLSRAIQVETEANAISADELGLSGGILDVGAITPEGWAPEPSAGYKFKALAAGKLSYYPERVVMTTPRAEAKQVLRYFKDVPLSLGYSKFYNSVELITSFSYTGAGIQKPVFRSRRHKTPNVEGIVEYNSYFAHQGDAAQRNIQVLPAADLSGLDNRTVSTPQPSMEDVRTQLQDKWYGDPTQFFHVAASESDPLKDYPTAGWKVIYPGESNHPPTDLVYEDGESRAKTFAHSCVETNHNLSTNFIDVPGLRCQLKYGNRVFFTWVTTEPSCSPGSPASDPNTVIIQVPKIPGAQCDDEAHALSATLEWSHRWDASEWWQDVKDGNMAIYFKKPGVEAEDARGALLWQTKYAGDGIHVVLNDETSITNGPNRLLYPLGGFSKDRCTDPMVDTRSTVVCNNPGLQVFWKKRYRWGRDGDNQYNDLDANFDHWHEDATPQYFFTNHPELNWSSDYLFQKDEAIARKFNAHEMMLSGAEEPSETDPVTGAFRIGNRTRARVLEDFFDWEEANMADCMKRFQAKLELDPEKAKIEHAVKAQEICATDRGGRKQGQRGFAYRLEYKGGSLPTGLKATDIVENFFRRDRADGFAAWVHDQTDEQNTDRVRFAPRLDISDRMRTVTWDTVWATFPFGIYESQFPNGLALERADYRKNDATLRTVDGLVASTWKPVLDGVAKSLRKGKWRRHDGSESCPDDACYADLTGPPKTRALIALAEALGIPTDPLDPDKVTESVKGVVAFDATQAFAPLFEHLQSRDNAVYESPEGKKYLFLVRESFQPQLELTTWIAGQDLPEAVASSSVLAVLEADWTGTPSITAYVAYLNVPTILENWDSRKSKEMEVTKGYFFGSGDFNANTFRSRDNAPTLGDDQAADFFKAVNSSLYTFPSCVEDAEESLSPFCLRNGQLEFSPAIKGDFEWKAEILEKDGRNPHAALSLVSGTPGQTTNKFILDLATDATLRTFVTLKEPAGKTLPRSFTDDQGVEYSFKGYRIGHLDAKGVYKAIAVNPLLQVSPADDYLGDDILHDKDFWNHEVGETSPSPVLAEWDVTGLNGPSKVVVQLLYANPQGSQRIHHQVIDVRLGLTEFTDEGTPPMQSVEIQSAYRRASVTMPRGVMDENTMISIHPIALKDLPLPADFPEVTPIGPVLQVQTTGQKTFDPALRPTLAVQFSARELWARHAKPAPGESDVGKFEDATYAAVSSLLAEVMPSYKIHLLSAEGRLDPQPTIAVLENCDEPTGSGSMEDCLLKLTAEVSHFSYALVLFDEAGEGIPTILSKRLRPGDGFEIRGLRDIDREPLPDVEWILSANGDFDEAKTGTWTTVSVHPGDASNKAGSFTIEVPEQVALDGTNVVFVRYKNASIAAKAVVVREPSTLRVTGWEIEGNGFTPLCGEPKVFATFTANRSGRVAWIVRDGRGLPVAQGDGSFVPTSGNRIGWDGCSQAGRSPDGTYSWEFLFPEAPSQNVVMDLHVGTPSVAVVRSIVASRPWLIPSSTDPDHGIRFHVTFEPVVAPVDPVLVLDGPSGAEVRLPLVLQADGRWSAFWTGQDDDQIAASGVWSARYDGTLRGRAPRRDVEIRTAARTIVAQLEATPALITPPGMLAVKLTTGQKLIGALWIEAEPASSLPMTSILGRRPATELPEIPVDILPLEDQAGAPVARTWNVPVTGLVTSGAKVVFHWNSPDGQAGIASVDFATEEPDWLKATDLSVLEAVVHPQLKGRSAYSGKTGLSTLRIEAPRAGEVRLTVACGGKTETSTQPVKAGTNSFTWPTATTPVADLTLPSTCTWSVEAFRVAEPEVAYNVGSVSFEAQALARALVVPRVGQTSTDPMAVAAAQLLVSNGVEAAMVAENDGEVLDFMGAVPDGVLILVEGAPSDKIFDGTGRNSILRFIQGGGRVVFGGGIPMQQFRKGASLEKAPVERVLELHGFLSWETNTLIQDPKVARPFLRTVDKNGFSWMALNGQTDLFTSRCGTATCLSWSGSATELGVDLTRLPSGVYTLPLSETSFAALPDGKPDTDPKLSSSYYVQPIYAGFEASKTGSFVVLDPASTASTDLAIDAAMAAYRFYFSVDLGLSDAMVRSEPGAVPAGSLGPKDWIDPLPPGTVRPLRLVRGQTGSFTAQGILIGEIPRGQKASTVASIADPWSADEPPTTFPVEFPALGTQPVVAAGATATHGFTVPQDATFGEHVFGIDAAAATWNVPLSDGTIRAETEKITMNNKASAKVVVVSTLDPVVVFDAGMGAVTPGTGGKRSLKAARGLAMKISERAWKLKGKVTTEHVYGKVSLSLELPTTLATDPKKKSHKVATSIAAGSDIPFELEVALAGSSLPATLNELVGTLKVRDAFDNLVEFEVKITVDRDDPSIAKLHPTVDTKEAPYTGNVDRAKFVLPGRIDDCPADPDNPTPPQEPGEDPLPDDQLASDIELQYLLDAGPTAKVEVSSQATDLLKLWQVRLEAQPEDAEIDKKILLPVSLTFDEANGTAAGFAPGGQEWNLPAGLFKELYTGSYSLEVEDFAGNISKKSFRLVVDDAAPEVHVYHAKSTLVEEILGVANACDRKTNLKTYLTRAPLYAHPLPNREGTDPEDPNNKKYLEYWDAPDGAKSPMVVPTPKPFPLGTKDWEGVIETEPGVVRVPVVVNVNDLSPFTFKVTLAAAGDDMPEVVLLDASKGWNSASYSKYFGGVKDPGDPLSYPPEVEQALTMNPNSIYFQVPMPTTTTRRRVEIEVTDAGGRTTKVELVVGEPLEELVTTDPAGDRNGEGADFGDVYLTREDAASGSWLHGMVHAWKADHAGKDRPDAFYVDLDEDPSTGSDVVATAGGQPVRGFDVRVRFHRVSTRDDESGAKVGYSQWQSGRWSEERFWTNLTSTAQIRAGANQHNEPWTTALGEGDQLLPTGKVALAPGGLLEFSVLIDQRTVAGQKVRVFLAGSADQAGEDAGGAKKFELPRARSITADGRSADWIRSRIPRASVAAFEGSSIAHNLSNSPVGTRQQRVELSLRNIGWKSPEVLVVRQFLTFSGCEGIQADEDLSHEGWSLVSDAPRPVNEIQGYESVPDEVKYLEWRVQGSLLPAGSRIQGAPWVVLTAPATTACKDEMVQNSIRPLEGDVEVRDAQGTLLLGGSLPDPSRRRAPASEFRCQGSCLQAQTVTALSAVSIGPQWFKVVRTTPIQTLTATGNPGQVRVEGIGIFNDQASWPAPADGGNVHHVEVEPVSGSASWSILP